MPENLVKDNFETILEAIGLIEERLAKISQARDFISTSDGTLILDAIAMRLQVIGELVKKIDKSEPTLLRNYADIDWRVVMRLRDIISHHYDILDHEIIYDICKNHIPALKVTVTKISRNLGYG